jgi:branched-chain amino acid transport system ATP-binding protein
MSDPLLRVAGLAAYYGQLQAVRGVSFDVGAGEALAVIGENGAGKTTLFQSICGLHGSATGEVMFAGEQLRGLPAHTIVRRGIALVPEGRRIFPSLTVDENLRVAEDQHRRDRSHPRRWTRDRVYQLFPDLLAASRRGGHQISGGQQQMLAIGRALLSDPRRGRDPGLRRARRSPQHRVLRSPRLPPQGHRPSGRILSIAVAR